MRIKFTDTCEITRATGEMDEWDNLSYDLLYSGPCMYQANEEYSSDGVHTVGGLLFLPRIEDILLVGDVVEIVSSRGRSTKGVVCSVRDIDFQMSEQSLTRLVILPALKQSEV